MFVAPAPEELITEGDVEQKFIWPLLTTIGASSLGYSAGEVFSKPNIRSFKIGKGDKSKLYYPDYVLTFVGLPLALVEAKAPHEDLVEAARECRLYATEMNAVYPAKVNPCQFCIVSDGLSTELRSWDSDDVIARFTSSNPPTTPAS